MRKRKRRVVIMRGIPGAGKTTFVKAHYPGAVVCSADHFFEQGGEYKFDREKLPEAHQECMRKFLEATADVVPLGGNTILAEPLVVVDNTNMQFWEYAGYVQVAQARGYEVEVIRLEVEPEVAATRCVHGVTEAQIRRRLKAFEPAPKHLNEVVVVDGVDPRDSVEHALRHLRYKILMGHDHGAALERAQDLMGDKARVGMVGLGLGLVINTDGQDPTVECFDDITPLRMADHVVLRRSNGVVETWKARYPTSDVRFVAPEEVARLVDEGYDAAKTNAA